MFTILANASTEEIVITFFGAGLATGVILFLLAYAISSALKIFNKV